MRLKSYKVDNEPGNATKVVTLVKNVQTCRNFLCNLRHNDSTHFCHFSARKILGSTLIRRHVQARKRNTIQWKIKVIH